MPKPGVPCYETIGGGMGATAGVDGESAVHSHMTNTLNTPIEAPEYAYPFLVKEYSIRRGTGGNGRHRGGDGLVREIQMLAEVEATVLSECRRIGPYGLAGGEAGTPGRNTANDTNAVSLASPFLGCSPLILLSAVRKGCRYERALPAARST